MIALVLVATFAFAPLVLLVLNLTGLDRRLLTSARLRPNVAKEAER